MTNNPLAVQHGGTHYKGMTIQPIEFAVANNYDAAAFSTLKYVSRHAAKNGREDVLKGRHFVEIRLRLLTDSVFPIQLATDTLPVQTYIDENALGQYEAVILTNLHQWATGKIGMLSHEACARHILQQMDHLLEAAYPLLPQPKD